MLIRLFLSSSCPDLFTTKAIFAEWEQKLLAWLAQLVYFHLYLHNTFTQKEAFEGNPYSYYHDMEDQEVDLAG